MKVNTLKGGLSHALRNSVLWYLVTRYLVYFLAFIGTMIIAGRLGPFYLGIWGFVTLLLRYFHLIDFGLGNAVTVFLVRHKEEKTEQDNYEKSGVYVLIALSIIVVGLALYYYLFGIPFFEKYQLGPLFYAVCLLAILQYFTDYFWKVYRVKGKMFEFTFYQTFLPVVTFALSFFVEGEAGVYLLTAGYLLSFIVSLLLFIRGGQLSFGGTPRFSHVKGLLSKGFYLWVYNFGFYMIIISTKTVIGACYTVEEFGYFTFAYSLAQAAILLLTAFATLITPKLIDKFHSNDPEEISSTIRLLRVNYVCMSHVMMYAAMICFPILLLFLPKYQGTLEVINLCALAVVLYTNSFGFISFLTAKNKERLMALTSLVSLVVNVGIALGLYFLWHVGYVYIVLATMGSYFLFAYLAVYFGKRVLGDNCGVVSVMRDVFPLRLLIPFAGAVAVTIIDNVWLLWLPLLLFIALNWSSLMEIVASFKKILFKPQIVNISK
ncbi:MAG: oligosaccharide flippase family protein [Bacteroidales bacterium]|nr:oligosaccharide flippase family protein [Bacteroidales bacterium]